MGMKEIKQLIKHSGAIHIENNITLVQRQAWNIMAEIGRRNPDKTMHEITLNDLMYYLNWSKSHNQEYLKETLVALVRAVVQWNILNKDKINTWGVMGMLSQAVIEDGKLKYAFPPELSEWLKQTNMYAKLDLRIQNRIESKYGQALWEICVDAFDQSRGEGETPFIPLETFRKLMGVAEGSYPEFKIFRIHVIREALKVVNKVTNFDVTPDFQRKGRKVVAIKFRVKQVPGKSKEVPMQQHLFPDDKDMPPVVRELKQAGIDGNEAWKIFQQGFEYVDAVNRPEMSRYDVDPDRALEKYVREKIYLMKRKQATGKVKSAAGFLRQAIRKNWENMDAAQEAQLSERRRQAKERGQLQRRKDNLVYEREKLGSEQDKAARDVCMAIVQENPDALDTAIAELILKHVFFRNSYKHGQSALANFEEPRIYVFVDKWLEEKYPERFVTVRAEFKQKEADLDQQIAALSVKTAA
jgi:hypothetical protein